MRVLVTGREGQVARSLLERASGRADLDLVVAGRPHLDLAEPGSVTKLVRAMVPDVVINAAAYTAVDQAEEEPELAFRVNAEAAGEAATAAREVGAEIIQLSTDYVFDGRKNGAYVEGAETNPLNAYGRSKLAGEQMVSAANPDHLILRTAWLYSPFGRNFVKSIMSAARERDVVKVVDDQHGSPTSALDLADGVLAIIGRWSSADRTGIGEVYHLVGAGTASWFELAEQVMRDSRSLGLPWAKVEAIGTESWPTKAERPRNSTLESAKFASDFGFAMPDWRESVGAVVRRLASEG